MPHVTAIDAGRRTDLDAHEVEAIALELVDRIDAMLAYWNIDRVCVYANKAYCNLFGKQKHEVIGATMSGLLGPLYANNLPYLQAAYDGHAQVFERDLTGLDGRIRRCLATYTPRVVRGQVCGIFVHVADVGPLKTLEERLRTAVAKAEDLATHDFLTGLPNRVLMADRLEWTVALARRQRRCAAVLTVDIDGFKQLNDTLGQSEGDRLLVEIGRRLRQLLRESDSVMRFGGDEFLVLIPDVDSLASAETVAMRILSAINQPYASGTAKLMPTASVGVAVFPTHGATPETLMASSDDALHIAKQRGRNSYATPKAEGRLRGNVSL
jgi:diguanylate cyclase (GGDEF)-like protein/PAS domain S-box-containing protein